MGEPRVAIRELEANGTYFAFASRFGLRLGTRVPSVNRWIQVGGVSSNFGLTPNLVSWVGWNSLSPEMRTSTKFASLMGKLLVTFAHILVGKILVTL